MNLMELISLEAEKQNGAVQLIASENFVSEEILKIQGSILTNKYAEGYPGKRYYGGCDYVDGIENLAREYALKMFKNSDSYHVNVQPHSGSQANQAVYLSVLNPQDTVLGMSLDQGGHLTHGHKLSSSGILYDFHGYGVKGNELDYNMISEKLSTLKPKLLVVGASSFPYTIDFKKVREIVDKNSPETLIMADIAHIAGLIVGEQHNSPFGYVDYITSTTHKTLRGPRGGLIFCKKEFAKEIDRAVFPGIQGGPLMHVIGAKAQCFMEACTAEYKDYIYHVVNNSKVFSEEFKKLGYEVYGTENHLFLVDVYKTLGITGKEAQDILEKNEIIVNKNAVRNDPLSPMITSGIRLGTPAMTTKGYRDSKFVVLAQRIDKILREYAENK